MNYQEFNEQFNKCKNEDHIAVSRFDVNHNETVTYIIEKEGLITAFLEGTNEYNLSLVGLLGSDAYEKILKFVKGLASLDGASGAFSLEIKESNNTETYNISADSFTRFVLTMQDAINAGINLVNMSDIDKAKLIRKLKSKVSKKDN